MSGFQILLLAAVVVTCAAGVFDYRTGLIPNKITYPLLLVGAVAHVTLSLLSYGRASIGWTLLETLAGALVCGLIPVLLWKSNAMGGGDVKLLSGLGALLGPAIGLRVELYAFMAAVAAAPILLAYRGVLWATLKRSFALLLRPFRRSAAGAPAVAEIMTELRFGPAICAAMAIVAVLEWK
jgi:prepilin peptidase CpaA